MNVRTAAVTIVLALGCGMDAAHAQFVCGEAGTGDSRGAVATGASMACGPGAQASADSATATGVNAVASGVGATATGAGSEASGNFATATGEGAVANSVGATATGAGAFAIGALATATGEDAVASGDSATATGFQAVASGINATATGAGAKANGVGATALGASARALHDNSAAIGAGAKTERDNQMVFGTQSNTYTMGGITSKASRDAQTGPLEVVTTDAAGNLSSDGGAFQRQIDALGRRDSELADGIAIALAIQQPIFQAGQTFAIRAGYGNFDGADAIGLSAAGVLSRGGFGPGSSVTLDAGLGFGTATGTVAARAGVSLGW